MGACRFVWVLGGLYGCLEVCMGAWRFVLELVGLYECL